MTEAWVVWKEPAGRQNGLDAGWYYVDGNGIPTGPYTTEEQAREEMNTEMSDG